MKQTYPYNITRLFNASCLALITTAMTFAIRARLETVFKTDFNLSNEDIGFAFGPAFWGFTLAMVIGGPLVDWLGIKRIVWFAFLGHLLGITTTLFARDFMTLFFGTLFIGLGNGMVEAACNPLVATLYPRQKTKMLNRFHVWFPGGIVIGSLVAYILIDQINIAWEVLVALLYVPLFAYGFMFLGQPIPETERVTTGVSFNSMVKEIARPLFLLMVVLMLFTAATELGTGQRIESLLSATQVSGILVLAFINGIMAVGRAFAGPVVHKLNPKGMLLFSAVFSFLGLLWLSIAEGPITFAAAGMFAIGVCYFWPTMLSFVAEYMPKSGALGLSIMGGAGMLSVSVVLPVMGRFLDNSSGAETLRVFSILPLILILAFSLLYFLYKPEQAKQH
jgi:MFS family permease